MKVRVIANDPLGNSGKILTLDTKIPYQPGQWIGIRYRENIPSRMYSIKNPPETPGIQVLYTRIDDGELTPLLWNVLPGSTLDIEGPGGAFLPKQGKNLWISAGTGVAPFLSMTNLLLNQWFGPGNGVTLLESNRTFNDIFGYEDFTRLRNDGLLNYEVFVTQEATSEENKGIHNSRITQWLEKQKGDTLKSFDWIMICGSTQMILDIREFLIGRGVDFHRIVSEVYF